MLKHFLKSFILFGFLFIFSSKNLFAAEKPFGERPEVKKFIHQMVVKYHFKEKDLTTLFDSVKVREHIISSIKKPLEVNPWYRYQIMFVTEWRIREGVRFWNKYQAALDRAEKIYGVPASIIVATIGIETKYGRSTGSYRVIEALTNIAFSNSPRAGFFRGELEQFLLLAREKHLDPLKVMGSYAGAIGQPQFMPSSYRQYAVDFSGDKKMDLSHNEVDVIGSVANYYHQHGWLLNAPVVVPATTTGYRFESLLDSSKSIPVNSWINYGIIPRGNILPTEKANLISLRGYFRNEYWLSFHNFNVIMRYNHSPLYAMAVYQLSQYITALKGRISDE